MSRLITFSIVALAALVFGACATEPVVTVIGTLIVQKSIHHSWNPVPMIGVNPVSLASVHGG